MPDSQIPALPQQLSGVQLVNAINDRLRRISTALDAETAASPEAPLVVYGTHADRVNRPVPADATIYVETDRNGVAYQARGTAWVWLFGVYRQTQSQTAALASTLGAADTGLLVYSSDGFLLYRWSGTAFVRQDVYEPVIADTHANRLSAYPSTRYAVGQEFWESDRTVRYIVRNAAGTVTVSGGTTVTWTAGNHFVNSGTGWTAAQWPAGTAIVVGGVTCAVASVASPTVLTLAVATTNGSGVAYSVASGRWAFEAETMQQAWANLPTDLGDADTGFVYYDNTNSFHIWQWTGSAWVWGPGNRASGEMAEFDADPGTGWALCDGTGSLTKYAANGTRSTTFTVPDRRGFYTVGGAYTGTGVAAAPATASGTAVGLTTSAGSVNAGTGAPAGFLATVTVSSVTDPTIAAGVPPVATFATLYYYRL